MNMLFLFLGILTSSTSYELVKIPVGMAAKQITCEKAFNNTVSFIENPNYQSGTNQSMTLVKYKGRDVLFHYCQDSLGKYKQ